MRYRLSIQTSKEETSKEYFKTKEHAIEAFYTLVEAYSKLRYPFFMVSNADGRFKIRDELCFASFSNSEEHPATIIKITEHEDK
jgi:hypothetical protein